MTNRQRARNQAADRAPGRVIAPLVFVTIALLAAGCFQPQVAGDRAVVGQAVGGQAVGDPVAAKAEALRALRSVPAAAEDDFATVQVLPDGNVADTPISLAAPNDVVTTTPIRWVRNLAQTTLWSGSDAAASAFTDLPASSFLRTNGPQVGQRLPVYYVGDGLLRRPGNGWVDYAAVETVDAPPPGQVSAVDADASQPLPIWVQAHRATTLWSGPDDKAATLTDLPQWTFLKIAGIERDGRLLINYAGDYATRQPGIGWVDQAAIGPSGDPGRWVTNHRATPLWSGVDDSAKRFTDLPQWSKLRIAEGAVPDANRMQVEFFGDGLTRLPGLAWIGRADVGPITPPVPLPAVKPLVAAVSPQVERHTFGSGADFINTVGAAAQTSRKLTGVPASVTVAQAILESDWGRSRLARQGNNLFGIKALGSASGPAGVVTLATWEHLDGGDVIVQQPFKAYQTLEQSIVDHGSFFTRNRRYAQALSVAADARAFAQAIQDAGYATDPSYGSKLIALMDRYDLYRFDNP